MDAELEFAIQSVTTGKQLFEQVSFIGTMSGLNTEADICKLIDDTQKSMFGMTTYLIVSMLKHFTVNSILLSLFVCIVMAVKQLNSHASESPN